MSFAEAIRSGFTKYVKFEGRASRREFWYWLLFVALSIAILNLIKGSLGAVQGGFGDLDVFFFLATLPATLSVGARRMHDIGKPGWWQLIPVYSWYLAAQPGEDGDNKYGVPPGRSEHGWGAR